MISKKWWLLGGGVVAFAAIAAAAFFFGPWGDDKATTDSLDTSDPATAAAVDFARHWSDGTLTETPVTPETKDALALAPFVTAELRAAGTGPKVKVTGVEKIDKSTRRAALSVSWDLGGGRRWDYASSVDLVAGDGDTWLVDWSAKTIEPSLASGDVLRASRATTKRGQILDTAGHTLTAGQTTVKIFIRKSRAEDPDATARTAAQLAGVDAEALAAKVAAAGPEELVPVAELPRSDYDRIRDQIRPLAGTVFEESSAEPADVAAGYAAPVLGTVGPATAEIANASEGRIVEGQITGLSGLQRSQDKVLAGTPGLTIEIVPQNGVARSLKTFPPVDGADLTVTLDVDIQTAAETAVKTSSKPAALVAVRVSTGEIVAMANSSSSYNLALQGRFPPGSVFKIPSTYALQQHAALTPDTVVNCPDTVTVGKVFRNSEGSSYGEVPFRTDFAKSCNTAFVGESSKITADQLAAAARSLGYRDLDIGLPMFEASVPTDGDATEHAAQMIGQGRVEGNVLNVALSSASVASGTSLEPRLIAPTGTSDGNGAATTTTAAAKGAALDAGQMDALRSMMRSVVTDGTGTVLGKVPGGEVSAKTGTAEFGTQSPPETHAWITGFQGDLAFAVVVEGGGFGGQVAGPIAAAFLTDLAS